MAELPVTRPGHACAGVALLVSGCVRPAPTEPRATLVDAQRIAAVESAAARIDASSGTDVAWSRLADLVTRFPRRISGSPALAGAIAWAERRMREDGLDAVRSEPVLVPHWVRGAEQGRIVRPVRRPLALLALGGSIGTHGTLRAPLATFGSLDELRESAAPLDGRIAFVDHHMPAYDDARDDPGYREGVRARLHAASEAAKRGARAVLVRSVTAAISPLPHAGALLYDDGRKIPAAAISTADADALAALAARGPVEVELTLGARQLADAPSANVVGELRGRERPEEIVLLGAHLDSWDVGPGASDDAAGCVAVMEAVRLLGHAGIVPRRTIRVVLFTAEEYALAGARAYAAAHAAEHHVAVFETDYGMAAPDAIGVGSEDRLSTMTPLLPAFARFGIRRFQPRAFGADVRPLVDRGAMAFDLEPDGHHYFDVHHTAADTLDRIRPDDLRQNAAAVALLAWVLAE